jgi:hypothetical protein
MKLSIKGVADPTPLMLQLQEGLNQHAVLSGRLVVQGARRRLGELVGTEVCCTLSSLHGLQRSGVVFRGRLHSVEGFGNEVSFMALGESGERDRAICTRMLGGPTPTELRRLPGIEPLLKQVEGTPLLSQRVSCFYQFAATDYRALLHLAELSGAYIVSNGVGPITFANKANTTDKVIQSNEILPGSERLSFVRTLETATVLSFNPDRDEAPAQGATAGSVRDLGHQIYPAAWGMEISDAQRARRWQLVENSKKVRWSATLAPSLADITAGDAVRLKTDVDGAPEQWLVHRRTLSFDPHAPAWAGQLTNFIECGPVEAPPVSAEPCALGPVVRLVGRVAHVVDPRRLGRVKVAFACHNRHGAPESWDGLWCPVARPVAGHHGNKTHGSLDLPREGDWVLATVDPDGCEPPLVLTSCYRNQTPALAQPKHERILFSTPDGVGMWVRDAADGKPASIEFKIGNHCSLTMDADGKVVWQTQTFDVHGQASIKGNTVVDGQLDVT